MEGFSGSDHILHVGVKVAVIRYIFTGFVDQSCFGRHAGVPNFVEQSVANALLNAVHEGTVLAYFKASLVQTTRHERIKFRAQDVLFID